MINISQVEVFVNRSFGFFYNYLACFFTKVYTVEKTAQSELCPRCSLVWTAVRSSR